MTIGIDEPTQTIDHIENNSGDGFPGGSQPLGSGLAAGSGGLARRWQDFRWIRSFASRVRRPLASGRPSARPLALLMVLVISIAAPLAVGAIPALLRSGNPTPGATPAPRTAGGEFTA